MTKSTLKRRRSTATSRKKHSVSPLLASQVPAAVRAFCAPSGTARFAAGKRLCATAERHPARVYPHFDAIAARLDSDNQIVQWNAMQILSRLAPVDKARKLDALVGAFAAFVRGHSLVSAVNSIAGLCRIAAARPDLMDRVIPGVLAVERATYRTSECRNVAIGRALAGLRTIASMVLHRADVAAFVRRQARNSRPGVAREAHSLINGWQSDSGFAKVGRSAPA